MLRPRPPYVLLGGVAGAAFVVTLAVGLPATDEGPTALAVVALVLLLVWSAAAAVVPVGWRPVTWPALALGAVPVGVLVLALLAEAAARLALVGDPFSASAGVSLPASSGFDDGVLAHPALLVPGVLGLLVALACVTRSRGRATWPLAAAVVALAGAATLALLPVPLWTVVVPVVLVALALVAGALGRDDRVGVVRAGAGGVVALVATAIALPSAVLTTIALGALVLAAAAVAVVGRFPHARSAAWAVLPGGDGRPAVVGRRGRRRRPRRTAGSRCCWWWGCSRSGGPGWRASCPPRRAARSRPWPPSTRPAWRPPPSRCT